MRIGGILMIVATSLAFLAQPAGAVSPDPLPASTFQAADGDQLDAGALADWQGLVAAGRVAHGPDDNVADTGFEGGNKELEPGQWLFTTTADGVTPSKNNILAAWYASERTESGTFLYLAFHRQATEGATFLGYELNQLATAFVNQVGETVPCRVDGDVILSYEVDPSDPEGVRIVLYRWSATATDPATGCSTTGTFTADPALAGTHAQAAMNFAGDTTSFLPGAPGILAAGSFGEGALNFTQIIGAESCTRYQQIQLHSRTSAAISAALKDFLAPVPFAIGGCAIDVVKTGPATARHGDAVTFRYAVTNPGSRPLSGVVLTDDKCSPISGPTGDADGDGLLDLFETWEYACTTTIGAHADGEENPIVNTATVTGSFLGQVVTDRDTHATEILHPQPPAATPATEQTGIEAGRGVLEKRARQRSARPGDVVTYVITYRNLGPGTAHDLTICDDLPRLVTLVRARGGRLAAGRVCWRHDRVAAGQKVRMRLRVRLDRDARARVLRNVVVAWGPGTPRLTTTHRLRIRRRPPVARGGGVAG